MKYCSILTVMIVFLLSSCDKDNDLDKKSIVPLSVGNKWTYKLFQIEEGQKVEYENSTITIDKKTTLNIDGEAITAFQKTLKQGNFSSQSFVGTSSDGFYNLGEIVDLTNMVQSSTSHQIVYLGEDTLKYKMLGAKYPIKLSDKWETNKIGLSYESENGVITITSKSMTVSVECIETNKLIKTGLREFECIGYKYNAGDYYDIVYYAVGYGIIKTESYELGELVAYSILADIKLN